MKVVKSKLILAGILAGTSITGAGLSLAVAHADSPNSNGVARYTMRQDKLNAEAEVLGISPTDLQGKLKTEKMKQVIADAGLTPQTFRQKIKAQLQADLQAQGYSQTQINSSLAHHPRHHHDADKNDRD